MENPNEAVLITATKAAVRLGVSPRSVSRHLPTVKIGGRVLVHVAVIDAKIAEGRGGAS